MTRDNVKTFSIALFLITLLLVEPFLAKERIALGLEENQPVSVSEMFLRLLGELRYSLASYIWLKAEIYHHDLGLTVVTSRIGTGDPKKVGEMLALCKIVTQLDPGFIQAYDIGGWRLAQGLGKFNEAVRFLKEGLAQNPGNAELYADLGMIYFFYMKDYGGAIPYLEKSSRLTRDNFQKIAQLKMLGYSYKRLNRFSDAYRTFEELLKESPGDPGALHQLKLLQKKSVHKQELRR